MTVEGDASETASPWYRSFTGRLLLLFGVLIGILVLVGVRVWQTSNLSITDNAWVAHTLEVKEDTQTILAHLGAMQAAGIVYATSGAPLRLAEFESESSHLNDDLPALAQLVSDNPPQVKRVQAFGAAVLARRDLLTTAVRSRQQSGKVPPLPETGIDEVRRGASNVLAVENALLIQRRETADRTNRLTRKLTTSAVLFSTAFLGFTFWLIYTTHKRQKRDHQILDGALKETQRLSDSMQRILDNSIDVICTIDAQGCFRNISRACERILGYKPSEMIGNPFIDFVHLEDRRKTLEAATGISQGWEPTEFENRYVRKNGTTVHLMWSASWSDADQLMYCIARDVTERKKLIEDKERADALIRSLESLLPMCAWCHKIRDEHGHWESVDRYIEGRFETQVTHSICSECAQKKHSDD